MLKSPFAQTAHPTFFNWSQVSISTFLSYLLPKAFNRKPLDALADGLHIDLPGHFSAMSFPQSFD